MSNRMTYFDNLFEAVSASLSKKLQTSIFLQVVNSAPSHVWFCGWVILQHQRLLVRGWHCLHQVSDTIPCLPHIFSQMKQLPCISVVSLSISNQFIKSKLCKHHITDLTHITHLNHITDLKIILTSNTKIILPKTKYCKVPKVRTPRK